MMRSYSKERYQFLKELAHEREGSTPPSGQFGFRVILDDFRGMKEIPQTGFKTVLVDAKIAPKYRLHEIRQILLREGIEMGFLNELDEANLYFYYGSRPVMDDDELMGLVEGDEKIVFLVSRLEKPESATIASLSELDKTGPLYEDSLIGGNEGQAGRKDRTMVGTTSGDLSTQSRLPTSPVPFSSSRSSRLSSELLLSPIRPTSKRPGNAGSPLSERQPNRVNSLLFPKPLLGSKSPIGKRYIGNGTAVEPYLIPDHDVPLSPETSSVNTTAAGSCVVSAQVQASTLRPEQIALPIPTLSEKTGHLHAAAISLEANQRRNARERREAGQQEDRERRETDVITAADSTRTIPTEATNGSTWLTGDQSSRPSIPASHGMSDNTAQDRTIQSASPEPEPRPGQEDLTVSKPSASLHGNIEAASLDNIRQMRNVAQGKLLSLKRVLEKHRKTSLRYDIGLFLSETGALLEALPNDSVVIGVTGDTGAGKSSLINALLDEEQLVPTSAMKACTTVVTEIRYNPENQDSPEPYRAEITFIKASEWRRELERLMKEINEEEILSDNALDYDEDVQEVWEKLKAVYPRIQTLPHLRALSVEELVLEESVKTLFSSVETIKHTSSSAFAEAISVYVENQTHAEGSGNGLQYWPLIESVKLYTRAPLLRTGVVLVDLPGTHDSNAARGAIAQRYQDKCTHFLVVADIKRAVDNDTAKSICTELFNGQLASNGLINNIMFVCTQTDVFSLKEIKKECPEFQQQMIQIELEILDLKERKTRAEETKPSIEDEFKKLGKRLQTAQKRLSMWKAREEQNQQTVYGPVAVDGSRKRKRLDQPTESPTKRRKARKGSTLTTTMPDTEKEGADISGDEDSESEANFSQLPGRGKNKKEVAAKVSEYTKQTYSLEMLLQEISERRNAVISEILDLAAQIAARERTIDVLAIDARNRFSRDTIRKDFGQHIRDIDRYSFRKSDASSPIVCNAKAKRRDYEAIQAAFPVFCVSSQCYQKLIGKLPEDNSLNPFDDENQTNIPALKEHIFNTAEAPFRQAAKTFSVKLDRLLNSIHIWLTAEVDRRDEGTSDEKAEASRMFKETLRELSLSCAAHSSVFKAKLTEEFEYFVLKELDFGIEEAKNHSDTIVQEEWVTTQKIRWNTFRVICRNHGVRTERTRRRKGSGPKKISAVDMNSDLVKPLTASLSIGWEVLFQTQLTVEIDRHFRKLCKETTEKWAIIERNIGVFGLSEEQQDLLSNEGRIKIDELKVVKVDVEQLVARKQRELLVRFGLEAKPRMIPGYDATLAVPRGNGIFDRMKDALTDHIKSIKDTVFDDCAEAVRDELLDLMVLIVGKFEDVARENCLALTADLERYNVLGFDSTGSKHVGAPVRELRSSTSGVKKRKLPIQKEDVGKVVDGWAEELLRVLVPEREPVPEQGEGASGVQDGDTLMTG